MNARALAVRVFLGALGRTWKVDWLGLDHLEAARRRSPQGNVIYAFWHSSLAILAWTHRERDVQVLVSQHRDGEVIAQVLSGMGYGLVRGSTRRGGMQALFGLARQLESGRDVAVTVDGPVGPRYHVRQGVLLLARRTGRPIVPIVATARPCAFLPTWDALRLPAGWARVRVQHGEPLWVGAEASSQALAARARDLEALLVQTTREEELQHGRRIELLDVQERRSWIERRSELPHPPWPLRFLAGMHAGVRALDGALRPRAFGRGTRPWVVGIGNLEAGGTGKTPCVVALARALGGEGQRVGVLTRGHKGKLGRRHPHVLAHPAREDAADESRLLSLLLGPDVPIVVSRNKRRGLDLLRARGDLDVVLVDDALQTRSLAVDRHLVLLDWEAPFGNGHLLPAGRLREGPGALRRAHALLFTRAGAGVPRHPAWAHIQHCFLAREEILGLRRPGGSAVRPLELRGHGVALLCGLGRPRAFERSMETVARAGEFEIRRRVRVGDHADLLPSLRKLTGQLPRLECTHVVVSRKDLLRLPREVANAEPLLVLEQRLCVDSLEGLLRALFPALAHSSSKSAKFTDTEAGM